ncbi:MAG: hypothetical protein IT320_13580 [Anaerolineae bacterium]|nr:hypothetical protein [Anaerolineae bacterium]
MNDSPPQAAGRSFRWLSLAWGAAILFWLSMEDNNAIPVAILATGASGLATTAQTLRWLQTYPLQRHYRLPGAVLFGAISGAGAAIATALLMLLKTGLHSHVAPDYTFAQMIGMIERIPLWALAGAFAAFGVALVLDRRAQATAES